jgi:hypothetical protein
VTVRYRVAHIFDPDLPAGLGLAPLTGGHPELLVSSPERALLELLSETGSFESLEEVRQLVESTRNLRLPLLDQLLSHLTRIKVVRLAALLAAELALPWAELAQQHSRRLGGGRRWVAVGRTGERLDLAATRRTALTSPREGSGVEQALSMRGMHSSEPLAALGSRLA